jgi:hypothetical protein
VQEGKDEAAQAAADAAWAEESAFSESAHDEVQMWLDENEAQESGFVQEAEYDLDFSQVASAESAQREADKLRDEALQRAAAAKSEAVRAEAAKAAAAKAEAERREQAAKEAEARAEALHAAIKAEQEERESARLQAEWEAAKRQEEQAEEEARLEAERLHAEWEAAKREQEAADEAARVAAETPVTSADEAPVPAPGVRLEDLHMGAWVEIQIKGEWVRAQLTWQSPHSTLFMFTSHAGTAHSMSRRTLDKLRGAGHLKVVADRPVVDEALDQVAQAALKNSVEKKK